MAHLVLCRNKHELCLFGRLSSNLLRGLTHSKSNQHYFQKFLHKTQHYVYYMYIVHEDSYKKDLIIGQSLVSNPAVASW